MLTFRRNGQGGKRCKQSGWLRRFSSFAGKMGRDTHKRAEPRGPDRVKNWAQYNAGLIARGDVTMWIDQSVLASSGVGVSKRGRPCVYPDAVIQMLLGLKQVFRLPLRALQGFAMSLRKLAFANLPEPNYTTLAWRNAAIEAIARSDRREWKKASDYHRRSLVENLMYRLKTLTGHSLWAREAGSQATEVAIRAGVLNRMAVLARPHSVRVA